MSEQRPLAVTVEPGQRVPQIGEIGRQLPEPILVAGVDRLGRGGIGQTGRLDGEGGTVAGDFE